MYMYANKGIKDPLERFINHRYVICSFIKYINIIIADPTLNETYFHIISHTLTFICHLCLRKCSIQIPPTVSLTPVSNEISFNDLCSYLYFISID